MLAIIEENVKHRRISRFECDGIHIMRIELKTLFRAGKIIKRLKKRGVTTAAVCPRLCDELKAELNKCGIKIADGRELTKKMSSVFAFNAIADARISFDDLAVEIHSGNERAFRGVEFWSEYVRYVFLKGHCARKIRDAASDKLGFSAVVGEVPDGLCGNVLRLYFDDSDEVFSLEIQNGVKRFACADIRLPDAFAGKCNRESQLAFAQALVDSGALAVEAIEVTDVVFE